MDKILKDISRSLKSIDDSLKKIGKGINREVVVNIDSCNISDTGLEKLEEALRKTRQGLEAE